MGDTTGRLAELRQQRAAAGKQAAGGFPAYSPTEALGRLYEAGKGSARWVGVGKDRDFTTSVLGKLIKEGLLEGEHFYTSGSSKMLRPVNVRLTPKGLAKAKHDDEEYNERLRRHDEAEGKEASLYQKLQRVASMHPETRAHLVPLLRKYAADGDELMGGRTWGNPDPHSKPDDRSPYRKWKNSPPSGTDGSPQRTIYNEWYRLNVCPKKHNTTCGAPWLKDGPGAAEEDEKKTKKKATPQERVEMAKKA